MRTFRSVDSVRIALSAALGLSSFACGGIAAGPSPHGSTDASRSVSEAGDALARAGDAMASDDRATETPTPEAGNPDTSSLIDSGHRFTCVNPTPVVVGGVDTGYDTCQGGTVRRRAIVDCPSLLPRPAASACSWDGGGPECKVDKDCTARPYGSCFFSGVQVNGCYCAYGCARDSDCLSGQICQCGDPVGSCVEATCNAGTCGAGFDCATYSPQPGCPLTAFGCQTAGDTCFSNSDCATPPMGGRPDECSIPGQPGSANGSASRSCTSASCAVGRPFLVAGDARLPEVASRRDWCAPCDLPACDLPAATRACLAARWLEAARMEHASIGAFARFALQLLAVGAPPDLVAAAQRAMADETKHAQLCFALASAYAGRPLGPGPLAVDACLDATDLRALVATVFAEGCVGETVAAAEAREALDHAHDPAVRAILKTIAADETRHAELAWRTIAWAVEVGGAAVRDSVAAAFAEALMQDAPRLVADERPGPDDMLGHGVVGEVLRARLRNAVLAEVVVPCARRLLGRMARHEEQPAHFVG